MARRLRTPVCRLPKVPDDRATERRDELHRRLTDPEALHRLATLLYGHVDAEWREGVRR